MRFETRLLRTLNHPLFFVLLAALTVAYVLWGMHRSARQERAIDCLNTCAPDFGGTRVCVWEFDDEDNMHWLCSGELRSRRIR